jgi:hypothetical protein
MKQRYSLYCFFSIFFIIFSFSAYAGPAEVKPDTLEKVPSIVFQQTDYVFPMVLEGETVVHEYMVKNEGDAPLKIYSVKPG